jgi:hypothetical protein
MLPLCAGRSFCRWDAGGIFRQSIDCGQNGKGDNDVVRHFKSRLWVVAGAVVLLGISATIANAQIFKGPPPGSVYRDYGLFIDPSTGRVTTPEAAQNFPERVATGEIVLPNPTHTIDGVETANALRAEMVVSLWGGHIGTTPKWFYFNGSRVNIPELQTTPTNGECYASEFNVTVDIPVGSLSYSNTIQGDAGTQTCYGFGWPQWLWYGVILRVYYNPTSVSHPTGQITSPASASTFGENPTVAVATGGSVSADRVDVLAYYDGYDTDGDGVFQEYHHDYHKINDPAGPQIRNHVGTATGSGPNFQVPWNTSQVPDQQVGSVKLIARIRGTNGLWYVTQPVDNLSLFRQGASIRFYKPQNVPEAYWAQYYQGGYKTSNVTVPSSDRLGDGTAAWFHVRTWNGNNEAFLTPPQDLDYHVRINNYYFPQFGSGHSYSYDVLTVPVPDLNSGSNLIEFYAKTANDHGIEVCWPGPAVMVRYEGAYGSPQPQQAILVSPAENATDQGTSPVLRWRAALGSTAYKLEISTVPSFSTIVYSDTAITDTVRTVGPLPGMTMLYWRVCGKNPGATGAWSAVRSFTTRAVLTAPGLVAPPDNAVDQSTSVLGVWHSSPGATAYWLQVSADQTFSTGLVVDDTSVVDTTRMLSGLGNLTTYYWRVKAKSTAGSSGFSPVWQFTTAMPGPDSPVLTSPANNAVQVPTTATFTWSDVNGALSYHFQLATDPTFTTGIVKDDTTLTVPTRVVVGLVSGKKYYWRVRARNTAAYGNFSETWAFTAAIPLPAQVSLISPVHQANISAASVKLFWRAVPEPVIQYGVEYALDPGFNFAAQDSTAGDTTYTINSLIASRTYYWRIRARNSGGWGVYSETRSFTVVSTSVQEEEGVPTKMVLEQNYPNPFNPSTTVRFGLATSGHVNLEVYSIMGEKVATLVDATLPAGYFSVSFDARKMPSGVYFYRLTTNAERLIRRMVLAK